MALGKLLDLAKTTPTATQEQINIINEKMAQRRALVESQKKPKNQPKTEVKSTTPSIEKQKTESKKTESKKVEIKNIEPLLLPTQGIYQYIDLLIRDMTTGETIIFAEDEYDGHDAMEHFDVQTIQELIASGKLNYRTRKSAAAQKDRTKKKAEVFTPSWICKQMIDMCEPPTDWQELVNSTWLEITCGEAPYLSSRYDATTGEAIPLQERIGILDRKMNAINTNVNDYEEWLRWTMRAFKTTYGYEWQGDNLLIARINILRCFVENYRAKWNRMPEDELIRRFIDIIVWNLWQMDGLKDVIPMTDTPAKIRDWKAPKDEQIIEFRSLKPAKEEKPKKTKKKKE